MSDKNNAANNEIDLGVEDDGDVGGSENVGAIEDDEQSNIVMKETNIDVQEQSVAENSNQPSAQYGKQGKDSPEEHEVVSEDCKQADSTNVDEVQTDSSQTKTPHTEETKTTSPKTAISYANLTVSKCKKVFMAQGKISTKRIAAVVGGALAFILLISVFCAMANHMFISVDQEASLSSLSFKYPTNWKISIQEDDKLIIRNEDDSCKIQAEVVSAWKDKKVLIDKENGKTILSSTSDNNKKNSESEDVSYNECEGIKTVSKGNTSSKEYVYTVNVYDGYQIDKLELTFPNGSYESVAEKVLDSISVEKHTHKEGIWNVEKEASCAQEGEKAAECVGSNHKLVRTIEKKNHTPGDWEVLKDYTISSEGTVTPGTEVRKCTVCGAQVDSRKYTTTLSTSQLNALKKAASYLKYTSFSYESLIEQLEFEKFSHEDSVFAVDHCGANWNEQAAKKAQSYLKYSSFSRDRLIDQLMFEGFSYEQAEYGVNQTGL